jgi:thiosulfate reductase cytochrome b subunit
MSEPVPAKRVRFYRHAALVRAWHWINVLAIFFLLGSGLNIFNAHPRLYWGRYGDDADPAFLSLNAVDAPDGSTHGITQIGPWQFDTTGFLGWSKYEGQYYARGWPSWVTIPSFQDLADARHWHFLFAWILAINLGVYLVWSLWRRHLQRDILPSRADLRAIPKSIWDHVRLKHPTGDAAKRYNVLQRLAYLGVIGLILLMVVTGLTMSPAINAVAPWTLDLFGGRQSARSLHLISASLIVLFVLVHVTEVFLAGPVNEIRSMITGYFTVPREHK